ncbi:MAG: asparagine synthase (glutamine-hydrolyzing) [Lawsonibacter sp.]|jgi:asparagine synthase (glutamine-hydrolysing)
MCGICGFCDFTRSNANLEWQAIGHRMGKRFDQRDYDVKGLWQGKDCVLVYRERLRTDINQGNQPMYWRTGDDEFVLLYDGELYNAPTLRQQLKQEGVQLQTDSDTEVLLWMLILWGEEALAQLEGVYAFAFWDTTRRRLLCARDRFGMKQLFYAWQGDTLVFASQPEALFEYPGLSPRLGKDGLREVLGLGPVRTPGKGTFQGVQELLPANFLLVAPQGSTIQPYWELHSKPHSEDYSTTVERVRDLLTSAIQRQIVRDAPLCTFLSGGLDSSFVTAVTACTYTREGKPPLETYSFDSMGNSTNTQSGICQSDPHKPYLQQMVQAFHTRHRVILCDVPALAQRLEKSMEARGLPGMAEIDAAFLYFCEEVAKTHVVALSGVCADELFGGCPWFESNAIVQTDTFPWCPDLVHRREVIQKEIWEDLEVEAYVRGQFKKALAQCPHWEGEPMWEQRYREMAWLTLNWYMPCLLERESRMSWTSGLNIRVPFCDHHLVEYVWNIPYAMKAMNGQPKQILRDAARGLLPEQVRSQKKVFVPQSYNSLYGQLMRVALLRVLEDSNAPIHSLVDKAALLNILLNRNDEKGCIWFSQEMPISQMAAYLVQLNAWMVKFGLSI